MLNPEKYVSYPPEGSGIEIPAIKPDEVIDTIDDLEASCELADKVLAWWISKKN